MPLMTPKSIALEPEDGTPELLIDADTVIYCTGWSATSSIYDSATAAEIGLPTQVDKDDLRWLDLDAAADTEVLERFPMLSQPPEYQPRIPSRSPFRLYKTMVPFSIEKEQSIVFLGRLVVGNNFLVAEAQALWAVAYLDGRVKSSPDEMEHSIARMVAWSRRRYLNKGQCGVWCYFDVVKYVDMLLDQLCLDRHRSGWWLSKLITPLRAATFKDLIADYKSSFPKSSSRNGIEESAAR